MNAVLLDPTTLEELEFNRSFCPSVTLTAPLTDDPQELLALLTVNPRAAASGKTTRSCRPDHKCTSSKLLPAASMSEPSTVRRSSDCFQAPHGGRCADGRGWQ